MLMIGCAGTVPRIDHPLGVWIPDGKKPNGLLIHQSYLADYSSNHRQARWIFYKLVDDRTESQVKRGERFQPDPLVTEGPATLKDYRGGDSRGRHFDRGHLKPAADSRSSAAEMEESFYLSNISPQDPGFNRGIWRRLEEEIRRFVENDQELYIITGPCLHDNLPVIGANRVSIPERFYKAVYDLKPPQKKAIAFLIPNRNSSRPLTDFVISIDSLEKTVGIDFFPQLDDQLENQLEKTSRIEDWEFSVLPPNKETSPVNRKVLKH